MVHSIKVWCPVYLLMSKTCLEDFITPSIIFMHRQMFSFTLQTSRTCVISHEMYKLSIQIIQDPVRDSKIHVFSHFLRSKNFEAVNFKSPQKISRSRTTQDGYSEVSYDHQLSNAHTRVVIRQIQSDLQSQVPTSGFEIQIKNASFKLRKRCIPSHFFKSSGCTPPQLPTPILNPSQLI